MVDIVVMGLIRMATITPLPTPDSRLSTIDHPLSTLDYLQRRHGQLGVGVAAPDVAVEVAALDVAVGMAVAACGGRTG